MMHKIAKSNKMKHRSRRGFAIVLSLALISFVFLLVITLVSQVRQDMAYSDARENRILAKANARMGMMIAIGEIQKHLGPDMRISARADIYDERLDSLLSGTANEVDLNGNTVRDELPGGQRMWTGVWKNRGIGTENKTFDPYGKSTSPQPLNQDKASWNASYWSTDSSYDHHPAIEMAWLVSGNEGEKLALLNNKNIVTEHVEVPDGKEISDENTRQLPLNAGQEYIVGPNKNAWADHQQFVKSKISHYYHPLRELSDPDENDTITWLYKRGHPTLDKNLNRSTYRDDPFNFDTNKTFNDYSGVKVPKTPLFLKANSGNWEERQGAYAYWVGDEGIKAKVDFNGTFQLTRESKLSVAPSPNLDAGSFKLNSIKAERSKLLSNNDFLNLGNASENWEDFLVNHYHDITTHSFGVLSDLRTGGLKRDLSIAFGEMNASKTAKMGEQELNYLKNDFERNYIFRQKIRYLKEFPLFGESKKNVWLEGNKAPLDDEEALLAGPRWTVLADFHNLHTLKSDLLQVTPPDQFPRIAGDNNVIFNGNPKSGKGNTLISNDTKLFYNVGDSPKLSHRPEPKNHSLLPVLVSLRMGVCPVMKPGSDNLHTAIMPKIMLWNPYSKPLVLNNIYFEIPCSISAQAYQIDLKEYDLYRKWWVALYSIKKNPNIPYENGFPIPLNSMSDDYGKPENSIYALDKEKYYQNWFRYIREYGDEDDLFAYPARERYPAQKATNQPKLGHNFFGNENVFNFSNLSEQAKSNSLKNMYKKEGDNLPDTYLPFADWRDGLTPASLHINPAKIDYDDENPSVFHENSDLSIHFDQPKFTFFNYAQRTRHLIKKIKLQIVDQDGNQATIGPGEVVNFACFRGDGESLEVEEDFGEKEVSQEKEISGKTANNGYRWVKESLVIKVRKEEPQEDESERAFLFKNDFTTSTGLLSAWINLTGFSEISDKAVEQLTYSMFDDNFSYSNSVPNGYEDPEGLAMYMGNPSSNDKKLLTRYANWSCSEAAKEIQTSTTYLEDSYWSLGASDKQPGWGWEISVRMPGHKNNEHVTLNEFNVRALIHSSQHGKGKWVNSSELHDHKKTELDENYDGNNLSTTLSHYDQEVVDVFEDYNVSSDSIGKNFHVGKYPNIYQIPRYYPFDNKQDLEATIQQLKNQNSDDKTVENELHLKIQTRLNLKIEDLNNDTSPDIRAGKIRFIKLSNVGNESQEELLIDDPANALKMDHAEIPAALDGMKSIGFFLDITEKDKFSSSMEASEKAVLFETPNARPLSLFQYRHANLNHYLHGSNYSLGNSYSTVQVARHRSWARINHIVETPTEKGGMPSLEENKLQDIEAVQAAVEHFQKLYPKSGSKDNQWERKLREEFRGYDPPMYDTEGMIINGIKRNGAFLDWDDIDVTQGFAPWRTGSSSHQNISIDHSYYLNEAIMDGYFLSGAKTANDFRKLEGMSLGEKHYPFLWDAKNMESPFQKDSNSEANEENYAFGNSRILAYHRLGGDNKNFLKSDFYFNGKQLEDLPFSNWTPTSYSRLKNDGGFSEQIDRAFRYHSISGDILIDGAFNINSTSVDAWVAQLSSLRGIYSNNKSPMVRFIEQPDSSNWNKLKELTDEQIYTLAVEMVRHVKLRGPFLSFSDFVNRRLIPGPKIEGGTGPENFTLTSLEDWTINEDSNVSRETLDTVSGLRGPVQSAIASAGLNDLDSLKWKSKDKLIPEIPSERWSGNQFFDSSFGLLAVTKQQLLSPDKDKNRSIGRKMFISLPPPWIKAYNGKSFQIFNDFEKYPGQALGDAPENTLAVENSLTGAGKADWVMQADVLSPLAPSLAARSDTFVIRVMGETNSKSPAKTWIEVVVQRTPDYVKADLDAPHHRPHEPFMDQNLNGYWDEGLEKGAEYWTNLNYNKREYPDLPGDKNSHFRDGMPSDCSINLDPQEEDVNSQKGISIFGINQRFGRKFKIVQFRWLREQDV